MTFDTYGFPADSSYKVHFFPLPTPDSIRQLSRYDGFHPSNTILTKGHVKESGLRPLTQDMVYERDVEIVMKDATKIYADVFRPVDVKVPYILAMSPYGKSGRGHMQYDNSGPYNCGIPQSSLSGYQKFEGPDPAEWIPRGYAIINVDARGSFDSQGRMMRWGPQEAEDVWSICEWASGQEWCDGGVTMCGNSWLAVSQINAASRCPHPALKCIAPWEGHSDHYRDVMCRGGIPTIAFGTWMQGILVGRSLMENTARQVIEYPLFNGYWEAKRIPVDKIEIPIYQTASYSTFREAKTDKKWLRIINSQEWSDLYKRHNVDDLQRFYDRYLKNIDNRWEEETPKVRLSMIAFTGKDVVERPELEYPIARTRFNKFFLDSEGKTLTVESPKKGASASYEGHHLTDSLDFVLKVDKYTELAGYPVIKLWMSCNEHDDMDVMVQLRKMDASGKLLHHLNFPTIDGKEEGDDQDVNIFKFLGSTGALRASHRVSYNEAKSTFNEPFYDHDRREPIEPGTIVPLTIGVWPMGMILEAGESLVLRIAGHMLVLPEFKIMRLYEPQDANKGRHIIHSGGEYDSHIILPFIN